MKKALLSGFMLASFCVPAQILLHESFEGTTLPPDFGSFYRSNLTGTRTPVFGSAAGAPCDGSKLASLNLRGTAVTNAWYLVYSSNSSNGTDLSYSFQYAAKPYGTSRVEGNLEVQYSSDDGATWHTAGSSISISEAPGVAVPCTTVSGVIPGSQIPAGANFKIRIYSNSEVGVDYYMGIDNLKLEQVVSTLPSCVDVTFPSNNAVINNIVPVVNYNSVSNASSYKISLGTTPGGTDIINNVNNWRSLSYGIPLSAGLQFNTTHYLTVTSVNPMGDSVGCQSVSFNTGMPSCPVTRPATFTAGNVNLHWNAVSGASGYTVSMGSSPGATDLIDNQDVGNVVTYQPNVTLNPATTYYFTVKSYHGSYTSQGCTESMFISNPLPPANDACSSALDVNTFPFMYNQLDAVAATNNGGFMNVCSSPANDGVWYKFIGDGSSHTITVSNVASNFDPELQVYSGNCSALTCVVSRDTGLSGQSETVTFSTVAGTEYYVNVAHFSGVTDGAEGPFTISITRASMSTSELSKVAKEVTIVPNPFVDEVQFHGVDVVSISVVDATGRIVKELEVNRNSIHLGDLKSGMYILLLKHKDGTTSTVKAIRR